MKSRHLLRRGWRFFAGATKKFADDHLSAYAAQATFYLMLAVFPFTMLICMASRLLPLGEDSLLMAMRLIVPESYQSIGVEFVDSYYNQNIDSAKIVLILFLIWTASRLIQALMNGFNSAYGIEENRSQTILRLIGCLYTLALCAMLVALIVMYVLGSRLMKYLLGQLPDWYFIELLLSIARNLVSPMLLLVVFWLSYVILPSRKTKFRDELPGALLTAVFWRVAAALYSVFLKQSLARYSYVYGSLAGLIMILIWLYACVYCWLVGGEMNWYLKKLRTEGRLPRIFSVHFLQLFRRRQQTEP